MSRLSSGSVQGLRLWRSLERIAAVSLPGTPDFGGRERPCSRGLLLLRASVPFLWFSLPKEEKNKCIQPLKGVTAFPFLACTTCVNTWTHTSLTTTVRSVLLRVRLPRNLFYTHTHRHTRKALTSGEGDSGVEGHTAPLVAVEPVVFPPQLQEICRSN